MSVIDVGARQCDHLDGHGQRRTGVAVSDDGRRAFVTNIYDGTVAMLDTSAQSCGPSKWASKWDTYRGAE
jgi:DNA-binding beta-propeller fold protein YncE